MLSLDRTIQTKLEERRRGKKKKNKIKNKIKIIFSKKYSYNGCILDLPSTETHSIHNLIMAEF